MITVNVLLSGRLKLDGYGRGKPENGDGTFRLALPVGGGEAMPLVQSPHRDLGPSWTW